MGKSPSTKSKSGCGPWLLGIILLVLAIFIVVPILASNDPQLLARLETALKDGRTEVPTGTSDQLAVDRAIGFIIGVEWNGEELEEERYEIDGGIITVFDAAGLVLCSSPIDVERRPEWQALSNWERLGFWPEQDQGTMRVVDVRTGSPAAAAGLARGDVIERTGAWPAAPMGLRAALLTHLAGGEVSLGVLRDGEALDLTLTLPALLPDELLQGSHDPLGAWFDYAASRSDG